jgi:galactokinase
MAVGIDYLAERFAGQFGAQPASAWFSPGRVNLIGEYTDFNGGFVLPVAIDLGTYFAVGSNAEPKLTVYSEAFDTRISIALSGIAGQTVDGSWADYVKGSLVEVTARSASPTQGLDIYVAGDLPRNAGLSSSASFTVGILFLLNELWELGLESIDIVLAAKSVENNFIGLQCGVMDQYVVANGKVNNAVCLHCQNLESTLVPFEIHGYEIVVMDSRVPRKLSESLYNQRQEECATALELLQQDADIDYLCAASEQDLVGCAALSAEPVLFRRARHVVTENDRVQRSATALRAGDLHEFGRLMFASHQSLRDDFEVSCKELDVLVEAAANRPGVLGSRMTGAGFGGCTVSIVEAPAVAGFIDKVSSSYSKSTPYEARALRCQTGDGVKRLHQWN